MNSAKGYFFPVLLLLAWTVTGCGPEPADIAVHHVNVINVETGEVSPDRTVTVSNGKIRDIMEADPSLEAGRSIDAAGKYMIPGLWDMHVHFRGGDSLIAENRELLDLYIANGVTTVRDAGGDITPAIMDWRQRIRLGTLLGPQIYTSGPKLDGPDARWPGSIEMTTPRQVDETLDSLQSLGVDYVKIYDSTISPEVYTAILEQTEERGMLVTGHMPFSFYFRNALRHGLDATEHMYYVYKAGSSRANELTREYASRMNTENPLGFYEVLRRVMETYDPEVARETFRRMAEEGTSAVPTLYIGEVLAWLDEEDHAEDPYLRYIGPGIRQTYQGRLRGARNRSGEAAEFDRAMKQDFMEMIVPMNEAGVNILAGSDAGPYNSFVYPGQSLHRELQKLVEAGLSPLAALQAATVNGARFFGMADSTGKVAEGYEADLLILDANPLEDISNTRAIDRLILDGDRVLDRARLDALLEELADE